MDGPSYSTLRNRRFRRNGVSTIFAGRPRHNLPRLSKRQDQAESELEEESSDSSGDGASSDSSDSDSGEESEDEGLAPPVAPPADDPSSTPGLAPPQQPGVGDRPVGETPDENATTTLTPLVPAPSDAAPGRNPPNGEILTTLTPIAPPTTRPATPSAAPSQTSIRQPPPVANPPLASASSISTPTAGPSTTSAPPANSPPANSPPANSPPATSQADTAPEPSSPAESADPVNSVVPAPSDVDLTSIVRDGTVPTPTGNAQMEESAASESAPAVSPAATGGDDDRGTAIGITFATLALVALLVGVGILLFRKFRKNKPDVENGAGDARPKSLGPRTSRMMNNMNNMGAAPAPNMAQASPPNNISAVSYGYPSDDPAMQAAFNSTRNDLETMDYYVEKQMAAQGPRQPDAAYFDGRGASQPVGHDDGRYSWQVSGGKEASLPIVYRDADGRYTG